jgi:predicted dehydrogenase
MRFDVVGPNGSVSIVPAGSSGSNDVESHTKADRLLVHRGELGPDGTLADRDEHEDMPDEPDHQELCTREQRFFLRAIREDIDLSHHLEDAVRSLQIVLAADESVRTGRTVDL